MYDFITTTTDFRPLNPQERAARAREIAREQMLLSEGYRAQIKASAKGRMRQNLIVRLLTGLRMF